MFFGAWTFDDISPRVVLVSLKQSMLNPKWARLKPYQSDKDSYSIPGMWNHVKIPVIFAQQTDTWIWSIKNIGK